MGMHAGGMTSSSSPLYWNQRGGVGPLFLDFLNRTASDSVEHRGGVFSSVFGDLIGDCAARLARGVGESLVTLLASVGR